MYYSRLDATSTGWGRIAGPDIQSVSRSVRLSDHRAGSDGSAVYAQAGHAGSIGHHAHRSWWPTGGTGRPCGMLLGRRGLEGPSSLNGLKSMLHELSQAQDVPHHQNLLSAELRCFYLAAWSHFSPQTVYAAAVLLQPFLLSSWLEARPCHDLLSSSGPLACRQHSQFGQHGSSFWYLERAGPVQVPSRDLSSGLGGYWAQPL